jgi:hypothetical protein
MTSRTDRRPNTRLRYFVADPSGGQVVFSHNVRAFHGRATIVMSGEWSQTVTATSPCELVGSVAGLTDNAFQRLCREVLTVHGDGDTQLGTAAMKQAGVAARLMVNMKTGALECA